MNNFKTDYNGGLPFVLDDFRWIDQGYRKAFYGIMSSFGVVDQDTFILSGCALTVSGGIVTITEGYVSIGGEVCYVPNHTYSEPLPGYFQYWVIDVSYNSGGAKTFQNGVINEVYEVRVAKLSVGASLPSGHSVYDASKTIHKIIAERLPQESWINVYNQTVSGSDFSDGVYNVDARKDLSGFVHLRGVYYGGEDVVQGAVNTLMFTLPVGFRPLSLKRFVIAATSDTSATVPVCAVTIDTSGQVRIRTLQSDYSVLLDLSQLATFEAAE